MQEASFNGFFKLIIYMIGFYYLIKFLSKLFLPIIIKKAVNKVQENFDKHQSNPNFNQNREPDFQSSKKENPKSTKKIGDYIDYEELD